MKSSGSCMFVYVVALAFVLGAQIFPCMFIGTYRCPKNWTERSEIAARTVRVEPDERSIFRYNFDKIDVVSGRRGALGLRTAGPLVPTRFVSSRLRTGIRCRGPRRDL